MTTRNTHGDFALIEWDRRKRSYRIIVSAPRLGECATFYEGNCGEALDSALAIMRKWEDTPTPQPVNTT